MVDEVIRWATPINVFQRTALNDVEVGGVPVKKGQRVGLFYGSANYDEDVFEEPYTFDILRYPNPHLAFGGHGAHYCIGANLARQEIQLIFDALADHVPASAGSARPAGCGTAGSTASRRCRCYTAGLIQATRTLGRIGMPGERSDCVRATVRGAAMWRVARADSSGTSHHGRSAPAGRFR